MRPRTATIQVRKDKTMWHVEIGDSNAPAPIGSFVDKSLKVALVDAVFAWLEVEGLDD